MYKGSVFPLIVTLITVNMMYQNCQDVTNKLSRSRAREALPVPRFKDTWLSTARLFCNN